MTTFYISIILYILFLITFIIYSFFALHQLNQYGYEGDASKPAIIIYGIISLVIIFLSFFFLLI